VLEVGCGPGVAVELVVERLAGGRGQVVAIDRSATAVERARRRNAAAAFWTGPADAELRVVREVLRPGGTLHLVYGHGPAPADQEPDRASDPSVRGSDRIVAAILPNLARHGLAATVRTGPPLHVTARHERPTGPPGQAPA